MKYIFILTMLWSCLLNANDFEIDFSVDSAGNIAYHINGGKILNFGSVSSGGSQKYSLKLKNADLRKDLNIESMYSPCSCIKLPQMRKISIKAGQYVTLNVEINSIGYWGSITKSIQLELSRETRKQGVVIPIRFSVVDTQSIVPEKKRLTSGLEKNIRYKKYIGGKMERESAVIAWLFASENCPECDYTKKILLPALFEKTKQRGTVVLVNSDAQAGFELFLELQKKLKVEHTGDFPVLYYQGGLIFGTRRIKKLIPGDTQQQEGQR